jgi:hypothetical protein
VYTKFSVFDVDKHFDTLKSYEAKSVKIRSQITEGLLSGVGLMVIDRSINKVCSTKDLTTELSLDFLKKLKNQSRVSLKKVKLNNINYGSMAENFISIKRKKCGFLLANSTELKNIIPALERDTITHSMHHIWINVNQNEENPDPKLAIVKSKKTNNTKQQPAITGNGLIF